MSNDRTKVPIIIIIRWSGMYGVLRRYLLCSLDFDLQSACRVPSKDYQRGKNPKSWMINQCFTPVQTKQTLSESLPNKKQLAEAFPFRPSKQCKQSKLRISAVFLFVSKSGLQFTADFSSINSIW